MRQLTRLVLTSSFAALAIGAIPGVASATSVPGANGKIAFASGRASSGIPTPDAGDADARIWVADYPGGIPQQATTVPLNMQHRHPDWSPDHTKIVYAAGPAFVGPFAIWILDLKTGDQSPVVAAAAGQDRPTWSPDGTRIAYGSLGSIWTMGVAPFTAAVQVTTGTTDERPVWSPDGTTLYFNRGPQFSGVNGSGDKNIYKKVLGTPMGSEAPVVANANVDEWQPAVSPDGRRLCYTHGGKDSSADVWTVNVASGVPASPAPFSAVAGVGDLNCVWSPDGTTILYTQGAFGAGDLATRDVATGIDFQLLTSMNVPPPHFDGNSDWATNRSPTCDAKTANVAVNGFTTIGLSCVDPDFGAGAAAPTARPLDPGALEIASPPAHGNIGSLSNGAVVYTPNKDFQGTDSFTYTGSDGASNAAPATVTVTVTAAAGGGSGGGGGSTGGSGGSGGGGSARDVIAPVVSRIAVSPKRWRLGSGLARSARTVHAKVGTTISFRLSEAARATLGFERARAGRLVGRTCAAPTRRNRTHRRCTRYARAEQLAPLAATAGANRVRFQGRISRSHRLALGRYRVVVAARDAAGNRSKQRIGPAFTIVAR